MGDGGFVGGRGFGDFGLDGGLVVYGDGLEMAGVVAGCDTAEGSGCLGVHVDGDRLKLEAEAVIESENANSYAGLQLKALILITSSEASGGFVSVLCPASTAASRQFVRSISLCDWLDLVPDRSDWNRAGMGLVITPSPPFRALRPPCRTVFCLATLDRCRAIASFDTRRFSVGKADG